MSQLHRWFAALAVASAATCLKAAPITFDDATQLTGPFTMNIQTTNLFSWSSSPGVGGAAGRVNVTATSGNTTAIWNAQSFNATLSQPITVSTKYLESGRGAADTSFNVAGMIGLAAGTTTGFYGDAGLVWVGARVRNAGAAGQWILVAQYNAGSGAVQQDANATAAFTTTPGRWYEVAGTFTRSGSAFNYTVTLKDYGTDGLTLVPAFTKTITGSMTNATLAADTTVYAGFRGNNGGAGVGGGAAAWDNFSASVPEPTVMLIAAAGLPLLLRRRRA